MIRLARRGKLRRQHGERAGRVAREIEPQVAVDAAFRGVRTGRDKWRPQGAQKHGAHARSETAQKVTASLRLQQGEALLRTGG